MAHPQTLPKIHCCVISFVVKKSARHARFLGFTHIKAPGRSAMSVQTGHSPGARAIAGPYARTKNPGTSGVNFNVILKEIRYFTCVLGCAIECNAFRFPLLK